MVIGTRHEHGKSYDWDSLARLHEAGFIHNPAGKSKSVVFTPEGLSRSEELLNELFGRDSAGSTEAENAR